MMEKQKLHLSSDFCFSAIGKVSDFSTMEEKRGFIKTVKENVIPQTAVEVLEYLFGAVKHLL